MILRDIEFSTGKENKILLFTDLHAHDFKQFSEPEGDSTTRVKWTVLVLMKILDYAISNNIEHVFFLGDLFHSRKIIKSVVFTKIVDVLELYAEKGLKLHFISGNHDLVYNDPDAPIVYSKLTFIEHVNEPTIFSTSTGATIAAVPFRYDSEQLRLDLQGISEAVTTPHASNMLLGHFEVSGAVVSDEYVLNVPFDMDEMKGYPFKFVFSGHVHRRQMVTLMQGDKETFFWFVGTPLQCNFGESGNTCGFAIYDFDTMKPEFVDIQSLLSVPQFRKIRITSANDIKLFLKENKGHLDLDYFHFEITDPELKTDQLFKKVRFFTSDHVFDIADTVSEMPSSIKFDMNLSGYLDTYIQQCVIDQDMGWLDKQELGQYLLTITGDGNVAD